MVSPIIPPTYEIWECSQAECGLRFPVLSEEIGRISWNGACPRCKAPLLVVGRYACGAGEAQPFPDQAVSAPGRAHRRPLCALLDNIRSTWNVGSMLRTADGVGMEHVYLCGITPDGNHPKTVSAALGAQHSVAWSRHSNALRMSLALKDEGWKLWGLESGQIPGQAPVASLFDFHAEKISLPEKTLLIVGNERTGVDAEILAACDCILAIPMLGEKGSLNVAVAFGIAAYRLRFPYPRLNSPLPE